MEKVIKELIDRMDADELADCLFDSGDPIVAFYNIWSIQDRLRDQMEYQEDFIAQYLQEALDEALTNENKTALEVEYELRRAQGCVT